MSGVPWMVVALLITLAVMLPVIYVIAKGQIGQPVLIIFGAALLSLLFSVYIGNYYGWDIHVRTYFVVCVGFIGIATGAIIANSFKLRSELMGFTEKTHNMIPWGKQWIVLSFYIVITYLIIANIRRITGVESWSPIHLSKVYRNMSVVREGILDFGVRQLYRTERMLTFYLLYFMLNQKVNKNVKHFIIPGCGIILFTLQGVSMGARNDIIYLLFSGIAMYLVSFCKNHSEAFKIPKKMNVIILMAIVVVVGFSATRIFFGRTVKSSGGIYLSSYLGGSLFSLDRFVIQGNCNNYEGITFGGIWRSLSDYFGIQNDIYSFGHCWINGIYNGNTYTMFAKYYYDAGWIGVFFFSTLSSFVMTLWFRRMLLMRDSSKFRVSIVLYGYMSSALFLVLYDEHLLSTKLCFGLAIDICATLIIEFLIRRISIQKKILRIEKT